MRIFAYIYSFTCIYCMYSWLDCLLFQLYCLKKDFVINPKYCKKEVFKMNPNILQRLILIVAFICKYIRFPKSRTINDTLNRRYGDQVLRTFRSLERTSIRLSKANCHLQFLNTCKLYSLTPKFLRFKLYGKFVFCAYICLYL